MTRNPSTLSYYALSNHRRYRLQKLFGSPAFPVRFQSDQKKTSVYQKMKEHLPKAFFADVYIPKRFFKAAMRSRRSATSALALNLGLFVGDTLENDDVLCKK